MVAELQVVSEVQYSVVRILRSFESIRMQFGVVTSTMKKSPKVSRAGASFRVGQPCCDARCEELATKCVIAWALRGQAH